MNIPARKRTTSTRRDFHRIISMLTIIAALIFRIPLGRLIGDNGMAYFTQANEIYLVAAGTVSYGLSEAVAALVRYRVRREQYKSAGKVLNVALISGGGIGLILSLLFCIFGYNLAEKFFHVPLAGMAVRLMAPALFFSILTGVFWGYFQGNGSRVPIVHSQILHILFFAAGGIIGATLFHGYGVKVSAFLQNENYAGAYGAMGASVGILAASVFCFLHSLVLFLIFRKNAGKLTGREQQRNQEAGFQVAYMLIGTGILQGLYFLCFHGLHLLDYYLFFNFGANTVSRVNQWGQYYGRCLVIIGVISEVISMVCILPVRRIMISLDKGENRLAGEKMGILMHQCGIITMPAAALLAVLAENVLSILFSGNNQQMVPAIQAGSLTIIFYVFASVFMEMLEKGRKIKFAAGIGIVALVLHGAVLIMLLKTPKIGIMAVVAAVAVFYAAVAVSGFLLWGRSFQYRPEWMKGFVITIASAALSGGIALLLNKVLVPMLGMIISMIICILAAVMIYLVLLVVFRAFRKEELEEMAGGKLLILLAGLLHFT